MQELAWHQHASAHAPRITIQHKLTTPSDLQARQSRPAAPEHGKETGMHQTLNSMPCLVLLLCLCDFLLLGLLGGRLLLHRSCHQDDMETPIHACLLACRALSNTLGSSSSCPILVFILLALLGITIDTRVLFFFLFLLLPFVFGVIFSCCSFRTLWRRCIRSTEARGKASKQEIAQHSLKLMPLTCSDER